MNFLEEACKNRFLSRWPDSRLFTTKINDTGSIDFIVELADGGLVILEKKGRKSGVGSSRMSSAVAEQSVTRKKAIGLCKRAEKLACETDWKQTADSMKQLQLDWQQLGSVPKDDREDLWERFQTATQSFFDARSKWFDQCDKQRAANRKKAKRLIAKAKKIVGSDKWKETGDAVKSLQEDWKAVNPLPKDDADQLWQEFRDTTQIFFDRRAAHFESMDAERDENRRKAESLIDEAGRWSGSDDWKRAGDTLKSLQQQWKTVHPLPRKSADDLWRAFQDVCQKFFDRRTAPYAAKSGR